MQSLRQKLKKKCIVMQGEGMKRRKQKKTNEQNLALYVSTPSIMIFTPNMHVSF